MPDFFDLPLSSQDAYREQVFGKESAFGADVYKRLFGPDDEVEILDARQKEWHRAHGKLRMVSLSNADEVALALNSLTLNKGKRSDVVHFVRDPDIDDILYLSNRHFTLQEAHAIWK